MKSKRLLIVSLILAVVVCAGATLAWLATSSNSVVNSFTVGAVKVTLSETTGGSYQIIPSVSHAKDPTVTVKANSESCWLFVKLNKTDNPDTYLTYGIEDGWQPLSSESDVYYREVAKSDTDQSFTVLKNNEITVKATLTEEMINGIGTAPRLEFTAFAIQKESISSALDGWTSIKTAMEE